MWQGTLYDGKTAAGVPVTIEVGPEGFILTGEDGSGRSWRFAEMDLLQGRRSDEPVRLRHQGAFLVVHVGTFLAELPAEARGRLLRSPARKGLVLLAAGLIVSLLAGVGGYFFLLPPLLDFLAERVPPAWEERLGEQAAASLLAGFKVCEPAAGETAAEIMKRLEKAIPGNPYRFRVTIVDSKLVNAFALPGGRIIIMSGLLAAAATPEELAGVLAHESAHIVNRHALKAIMKSCSTSLLLQLLFGNDNLGGLAAGSLQTLSQLRYSRKTELEADRQGLALLAAAGIDPKGLLDFLGHLEGKEAGIAVPAYLSTHPATADRVLALQQAMVGLPEEKSRTPLPRLEEWKEGESCQTPS